MNAYGQLSLDGLELTDLKNWYENFFCHTISKVLCLLDWPFDRSSAVIEFLVVIIHPHIENCVANPCKLVDKKEFHFDLFVDRG